ncbi:MAG: hypothetical protein ACQETB_11775 [Halobacteriota archaeon]
MIISPSTIVAVGTVVLFVLALIAMAIGELLVAGFVFVAISVLLFLRETRL